MIAREKYNKLNKVCKNKIRRRKIEKENKNL